MKRFARRWWLGNRLSRVSFQNRADWDNMESSKPSSEKTLLITGAAGTVGRRVARRTAEAGYKVRCMVRATSNREPLRDLDVEIFEADLLDLNSLRRATEGIEIVVHTAAQLGDWCSEEESRAVNVDGLKNLITAANESGRLERFVHISSLGVYEARDHFQTDETIPPDTDGIDAYTRTKAAAEEVLHAARRENGFPFVILRPGFIYGPGDRHVVPRVVESVASGQMRLIGDGKNVLNNTYVGNLVDAILLAIEKDQAIGEVFNICDGRLVNRVEFIGTIADYLGKPRPGHVPLWLANVAVRFFETTGRWLGKKSAPVLTRTRLKFMTLNLDFSKEKAERILGYEPRVDFQEGMREALDWLAQQGQLAGLFQSGPGASRPSESRPSESRPSASSLSASSLSASSLSGGGASGPSHS